MTTIKRMTISVPKEVYDLMKRHPGPVNWSKIATRGFKEELKKSNLLPHIVPAVAVNWSEEEDNE